MKPLSTLMSIIIVHQQLYGRMLLFALLWLGTLTASQAQWQTAVSNTTQNLNNINYGSGQFVAVGASGTILTSPDGINWTSRMSGTTQSLKAVTYGSGQWVIVGNAGTILTSPDGIAWVTAVSNTTQTLDKVNYGGSQFVTVGDAGTILTSPDGSSWTVQLSETMQSLKAVTYGNGQWVIVGWGGKILTSPDGRNWTAQMSGISFAPLYGVSYGGGRFIVVKDGHYFPYKSVLTSTDGVSWTLVTVPLSSLRICQCDFPSLFDVIYEAGKWVAVGEYGAIITSIDGINWTNGSFSFSFFGISSSFYSTSYGNGKFVTVGEAGKIIYSSASALPVSLLSFNGQAEGITAHLSWETSWEKGASHFLIERSRDAKSFETVGRLQAQGTTTTNQKYSFLDEVLTSGLWYYRLRQVDLDGTLTYSQIIAVRIGTEPLETLTLSPNPSSGPMVLEYKVGIQSVSIYSLTGVVVEQQDFSQAVERWSWESTGQPAGMYLIRVQTQDGKSSTLRWIKP